MPIRSSLFLSLFAAIFLFAPGVPAEGAFLASNVPARQEFEGIVIEWNLVELSTRPGVRQNLLVGRPAGEAKGAVLLFPGGDGWLYGFDARTGEPGAWPECRAPARNDSEYFRR